MNYLWIILLIIVLACLIGFIIIQFVRKQFQDKLQSQLEKENTLTNELEALKSIQQDLNLQRENLTLKINSLNTHNLILEKQIEEQKSKVEELNKKVYHLDIHKNDLQISLTKAEAEIKNLSQKLIDERKQLEELNQRFSTEFENLAQKILDEKSAKFAK